MKEKDGLYAVIGGVKYPIKFIFAKSFGEAVFDGLIDVSLLRVVKDVDQSFYLEYAGYPSEDFNDDLWKKIDGFTMTPSEDRIRFFGDADFCVFAPGTIAQIADMVNAANGTELPLSEMQVRVLYRTRDMKILKAKRVGPYLTAVNCDGIPLK